MKCFNCGTELTDGVSFCKECGCRVDDELQKVFCKECGSELETDSKFCSVFGAKIASQEDMDIVQVDEAPEYEDEANDATIEWNMPHSQAPAGYFQRLWNKLDSYLKFCVIAATFLLFTLLIACVAHKPLAILSSVIQIGCLIASCGIHLGIIKTDKRWLWMVLLLVILVMFMPYFNDFKDKDKTVLNNEFVEETAAASEATVATTEYISAGETQTTDSETAQSEIILGSDTLVELVVDFPGNWFFNLYDVILKVDDTQIDILEHGNGKTYNLILDNGQHVLTVARKNDSGVKGHINLNINEDCAVTVKISCETDEVKIARMNYENRRKLEDNEVRVWKSSDDYVGMTYADAMTDLQQTGFTNITTRIIRDAGDSWGEPKADTIKSITVDGKESFISSDVFDKDAEVIVVYHVMAYTQNEILSEFSKYVEKPANDILAYFEDTICEVECYVEKKKINDFNPEGYLFLSGSVSKDGKKVSLNFSTPELIAMREKLETDFPQDVAERAVVLSMTDAQEPEKNHEYTNITDFYLSIYRSGTWSVVDEKTWHVEDLECLMSGRTDGIRVICDISIDGNDYLLSNVKKVTLSKDDLKNKKSTSSYTHYDSEKNYSFLRVSSISVKDARDSKTETDRNNRTMPTDARVEWVEKQFRSGYHGSLVSLIKDNLNDEKSFKHKETQYYEVLTNDTKIYFNTFLASYGYSSRVEIGDIFITCEFTAKNAFNATIKSTALGYVSYSKDMVYLIDIK